MCVAKGAGDWLATAGERRGNTAARGEERKGEERTEERRKERTEELQFCLFGNVFVATW